jgi:hypothetical protein
MLKPFIASAVVIAMLLTGCGLFPESTFELSQETRLPKWFTLPKGLVRSDVTVSMSYYIDSSGRSVTFELRDIQKNKIAKVKGTQLGLDPLELGVAKAEATSKYSSYEIITINGITEVIEHRRMEPIFYITDDPNVISELKAKYLSKTDRKP